VIVGLDIRSFIDAAIDLGDGIVMRLPVGDHPDEVTQRILRGIPISTIRDRARQEMIDAASLASLAVKSVPLEPEAPEPDPEEVAAVDEWAAERISMLTAKGEPRKRRPPATEDLLRHVAALYTEAVGQGDTMPAKYVEDHLRAAGEERLSTAGARVQVRQWIRRARERRYLTIPPRREGL
jgi:hypothetical protein